MKRTRKHKTEGRLSTAGSRGTAKATATAGLSGDEARLWSHVTRNASKLPVKAARRVSQGVNDSGSHHALFQEMMSVPVRQIGSDTDGRSRAAGGDQTAPNSAARHGPAAAPLGKRKARNVAKGRIELEARIDLHGMRQREAHSALRSFLLDCHAKGYRLVLVITGKGTSQRRRDDADYDNADRHWGGSFEEPGILKRNVPGWMSEADLAAIVVSYSDAHRRHGGDGALYVQLKKRMSHRPMV